MYDAIVIRPLASSPLSESAVGEHAVDTMPKDSKVPDGPTQLAYARRIEQEHAQLHAEFIREVSGMHARFDDEAV